MALSAHGHIIEEPKEDNRSDEIKRDLEEKDSFGKRMKQQPEKSGSGRENMFGKCSTTSLQIVINILEPSQSYGYGSDASRAISFHWQMCSTVVFYYVYLHIFPFPTVYEGV